jgi:hypothetical protein
MTIWVYRDGKLVDKASLPPPKVERSAFPTPRISSMEAFESPVTGKDISSWRERDRDMDAAGAYDPRDLPRDHVYPHSRVAEEQGDGGRSENFEWGRIPDPDDAA